MNPSDERPVSPGTPDRPGAPYVPPASVPPGYHEGLILAITVLLAFTLAFLRYWAFDAPGDWSWLSVASAAAIVVSVLLQLVALFRALRLQDEQAAVYRVTVRWFAVAVILLVLGVFLAAFEVDVML